MAARILVVDDIFPNVKLLEAKLTSEYYEVITASSGQEALDKMATDNPDLVLLDVMMPGMDGFQVCEKIKSNPNTKHTPVVMVTALTDTEDKVRGLKAGADDFLSKPIDDVALMARVRSLVRLKMAMDEWRVREKTANQLGVVDEATSLMDESVENAKVLLIEDKDFDQRKIEDALGMDNHTITAVKTGIEAMEANAAHEFDLIIISLNLANEDGLRLTSHFKSNDKTRMTPIVLVGKQDEIERVAHGLEIGVHDYILRPIDKNEMLVRARTQIRRKRFQERLRSTYEISLSMALTDSLTGLYNRRYLEVHLRKLLDLNARMGKSLAVLMIDIDHFKSVNDTHGHGVGDEILKVFAERLKDGLRSFDMVARIGGEEFVVILPEVSPERAYRVAERLRIAVSKDAIPCEVEGGGLRITASVGGAILGPEAISTEESIKRADKQLYNAKNEGRNCTVFEDIGKLDPNNYPADLRDLTETGD